MKKQSFYNQKDRAKSPKLNPQKKGTKKSLNQDSNMQSRENFSVQKKSNCFDEYFVMQLDRFNENKQVLEQPQDFSITQKIRPDYDQQVKVVVNSSSPSIQSQSPKLRIEGIDESNQHIKDQTIKNTVKDEAIKILEQTIQRMESEHKEKFHILIAINEHQRLQIEANDKNLNNIKLNFLSDFKTPSSSTQKFDLYVKSERIDRGISPQSGSPTKKKISSNSIKRQNNGTQTLNYVETIQTDLDNAIIKIQALEQAKVQFVKMRDSLPITNPPLVESANNSKKQTKSTKTTLEKEIDQLAKILLIKSEFSSIEKLKKISSIIQDQENQIKQLSKVSSINSQGKGQKISCSVNEYEAQKYNDEENLKEKLKQLRILQENFYSALRGLDDPNTNISIQNQKQIQQKSSSSNQITEIVNDLTQLVNKSIILEKNDFNFLRSFMVASDTALKNIEIKDHQILDQVQKQLQVSQQENQQLRFTLYEEKQKKQKSRDSDQPLDNGLIIKSLEISIKLKEGQIKDLVNREANLNQQIGVLTSQNLKQAFLIDQQQNIEDQQENQTSLITGLMLNGKAQELEIQKLQNINLQSNENQQEINNLKNYIQELKQSNKVKEVEIISLKIELESIETNLASQNNQSSQNYSQDHQQHQIDNLTQQNTKNNNLIELQSQKIRDMEVSLQEKSKDFNKSEQRLEESQQQLSACQYFVEKQKESIQKQLELISCLNQELTKKQEVLTTQSLQINQISLQEQQNQTNKLNQSQTQQRIIDEMQLQHQKIVEIKNQDLQNMRETLDDLRLQLSNSQKNNQLLITSSTKIKDDMIESLDKEISLKQDQLRTTNQQMQQIIIQEQQKKQNGSFEKKNLNGDVEQELLDSTEQKSKDQQFTVVQTELEDYKIKTVVLTQNYNKLEKVIESLNKEIQLNQDNIKNQYQQIQELILKDQQKNQDHLNQSQNQEQIISDLQIKYKFLEKKNDDFQDIDKQLKNAKQELYESQKNLLMQSEFNNKQAQLINCLSQEIFQIQQKQDILQEFGHKEEQNKINDLKEQQSQQQIINDLQSQLKEVEYKIQEFKDIDTQFKGVQQELSTSQNNLVLSNQATKKQQDILDILNSEIQQLKTNIATQNLQIQEQQKNNHSTNQSQSSQQTIDEMQVQHQKLIEVKVQEFQNIEKQFLDIQQELNSSQNQLDHLIENSMQQQEIIGSLNQQLTQKQGITSTENCQIKEIETLQSKMNEFEQLKQDAENIHKQLQNELIEQNNQMENHKNRILELEQFHNLKEDTIRQQKEEFLGQLKYIQDLLEQKELQIEEFKRDRLKSDGLIQSQENIKQSTQEVFQLFIYTQNEISLNLGDEGNKLLESVHLQETKEEQNDNPLESIIIQKGKIRSKTMSKSVKFQIETQQTIYVSQELKDQEAIEIQHLKSSQKESTDQFNGELIDQNNIIKNLMKKIQELKHSNLILEQKNEEYEASEQFQWKQQFDELNEYCETQVFQLSQMEQLCESQLQEIENYKNGIVEPTQESQKLQELATLDKNTILKLRQKISTLEQKVEQNSQQLNQSKTFWHLQIQCEEASIKSLIKSGWIFYLKNQEDFQEFKTQILIFSSNADTLRQLTQQAFNSGAPYLDIMNSELQSFKVLNSEGLGNYLLGGVVLEQIKVNQVQQVEPNLAGKLALQQLWAQYILQTEGILLFICLNQDDLQQLLRITYLYLSLNSNAKLIVLSPTKDNLVDLFELKDYFTQISSNKIGSKVSSKMIWIKYGTIQSKQIETFLHQQLAIKLKQNSQTDSFVNLLREYIFQSIGQFFTVPDNSQSDFNFDSLMEGDAVSEGEAFKLQLLFRDQDGNEIKQKLKLHHSNLFLQFFDQNQSKLMINDNQIQMIINQSFLSKILDLKIKAFRYNEDQNQLVVIKFQVQGKSKQFWFYLNQTQIQNLTPTLTQDEEKIVFLFD